MVPPVSPVHARYRFRAGRLAPLDVFDPAETRVLVADSWLVDEGATLALPLHLSRFREAVTARSPDLAEELEAFLRAVIEKLPAEGAWFPRIELVEGGEGQFFLYRERRAPDRHSSVRLATFGGPEPRRHPTVKGPDFERLMAARTAVQALGADEAVILSSDGVVIEGAYSALLWWRGDTLCVPALDLLRVDSVTARSIIALATARGMDVSYESVVPAELDGLEVWATSALHGIRIATKWIDGPSLAEQPGRLSAWRAALDKLSRPIVTLGA